MSEVQNPPAQAETTSPESDCIRQLEAKLHEAVECQDLLSQGIKKFATLRMDAEGRLPAPLCPWHRPQRHRISWPRQSPPHKMLAVVVVMLRLPRAS